MQKALNLKSIRDGAESSVDRLVDFLIGEVDLIHGTGAPLCDALDKIREFGVSGTTKDGLVVTKRILEKSMYCAVDDPATDIVLGIIEKKLYSVEVRFRSQ